MINNILKEKETITRRIYNFGEERFKFETIDHYKDIVEVYGEPQITLTKINNYDIVKVTTNFGYEDYIDNDVYSIREGINMALYNMYQRMIELSVECEKDKKDAELDCEERDNLIDILDELDEFDEESIYLNKKEFGYLLTDDELNDIDLYEVMYEDDENNEECMVSVSRKGYDIVVEFWYESTQRIVCHSFKEVEDAIRRIVRAWIKEKEKEYEWLNKNEEEE